MNRFPDAPAAILALPVDKRGFPVPYFVQYIDGEPDFRVMNTAHFIEAVQGAALLDLRRPDHRRCQRLCDRADVRGEPGVLGALPNHLECARFAAKKLPLPSRRPLPGAARPVFRLTPPPPGS